MAAAVQPSGLMDIASSLIQDEIPFKLRCAICNKLAVNAFKLPCCDQAICENCQASLPDTCPVCAHTPLSSDLCKPNKALRTTLKAFLRTEEKKREKERQAATPATPKIAAPTEETPVAQDVQVESNTVEAATADRIAPNQVEPLSAEKPADTATPAAENDEPSAEQIETNGITQDEPTATSEDQPSNAEPNKAVEGETAGESTGENEATEQLQQDASQNAISGAGFSNAMGFGMSPGMFPNMAWGANPMAQFMGNGMMGFPNPMAMSGMGMDQGMFGGFGMNMNGMNMGMNFNGQGMYGGWDGSQNNMWNGSQDKFNPNAFPNGMGAQLGDTSGFGGYNTNGVHPQMQQQQQYPNQEFQNGYYGTGNYRGRGRGYYSGRGRGGYGGHMQSNFPHNANNTAEGGSSMDQNGQPEEGATAIDGEAPLERRNGDNAAEEADGTQDPTLTDPNDQPNGKLESGPGANDVPGQTPNQGQLQGIPTIDSLEQPDAAFNRGMGMDMGMGVPPNMNQGFGRGGGGYMRGGFHGRGGSFGGQQFMQPNGMQPRGPGVEGAPAAPRAMREGLPNTSVFRQRSFQPGRGSHPSARGTEASETPQSEPVQENKNPPSASRSVSRARSRTKSRSRSPPSKSRSDSQRRYHHRSRSLGRNGDDYDRERERYRSSRRDERERLAPEDEGRTRSPSLESHRSSRRDDGRSRHSRRSRRSRRHRSRSRSASVSRRGDRDDDRLASIAEERSDSKPRSRNAEPHSSRREETRDRDRERDRDSRRRDRDRDRGRDRHREKERERDRDRDRPRERDRDRKRSRRDRSESAALEDDHYSRRTKRGREDDVRSSRDRTRDSREKTQPSSKPSNETEKDPHTLEREARNRERMLKEQQRREAMHADSGSGKPSRRRDSRQERSGRRLNYKYEDESESARADRIEREREANRWG
ncbi:hypothetical protein BDV19DRAFT_370339 [Aspergillus venezuelensis]